MWRRTLLLSIIASSVLCLLVPTRTPILLWNATPSVPVGLYWVADRVPSKGELAIVRLPEEATRLATSRGYLPARAWLIKPVAASAGDVVCRSGSIVIVNGQVTAHAYDTDHTARALPRWEGCKRLAAVETFLMSSAPDSFDGRYFGTVHRSRVLGTAVAAWFVH